MTTLLPPASTPSDVQWAKVIDHGRCIGCHACSTACKSENEVPLSVHRTFVKYVDAGTFPEARRAFQVTRCNQCEVPPCAIACPTAAMYRRPDGIVDFDKSICIGCKACIAACPYDAIFINPDDGAAEKCNFCAHRIDVGLEPACVVVCPTEAILVGNMRNGASRVAEIIGRDVVSVRRPEKETRPKVFYKDAHAATLDPLAARRPEGGLFLWSEQPDAAHVTSGHPGRPNSAAAAILSYDVAHGRPWGFKVSLYTWTKGVAAGAYLVAALLVLLGSVPATSALFRWVAPAVSAVFLAATGGLLVWDLKHPERFLLIFQRPQWRSWLVRGAFVIAAYSGVLVLHVFAALLGAAGFQTGLAWAGIPLAALTAVYTAFLFAQAKARDLWQSPLLPPHLLLQALLLGAAVLLPFGAGRHVAVLFDLACVLHVLVVLGEISLTHGTAHGRLAVREMTTGRYAKSFWPGLALVAAAVFVPFGWILAALGLLLHEHSHVQAGQSVPIA